MYDSFVSLSCLDLAGLGAVFLAILGPFAGAWAAFYLSKSNELERQRRVDASAGEAARFALNAQRNSLLNVRDQYINKFYGPNGEKPLLSCVQVPPIDTMSESVVKVEYNSLSFLYSKGGASQIMDCHVAEQSFDVAVAVIRKRTAFIRSSVYPKLKEKGLTELLGLNVEQPTLIEYRDVIGDDVFFEGEGFGSDFKDTVLVAIDKLYKAQHSLERALRGQFPEMDFMTYSKR